MNKIMNILFFILWFTIIYEKFVNNQNPDSFMVLLTIVTAIICYSEKGK